MNKSTEWSKDLYQKAKNKTKQTQTTNIFGHEYIEISDTYTLLC